MNFLGWFATIDIFINYVILISVIFFNYKRVGIVFCNIFKILFIFQNIN